MFTPEIVWHEKQPIFSVDFHHSGRLASGGADNFVRVSNKCGNNFTIDSFLKIWRIKDRDGSKLAPFFVSELSRHSSCVNVVRFSPDGKR